MTADNWVVRLFQVIRFLWVVLCIVATYLAVRFLTPLLFPFLIALIIALVINRPVTWLTEKGRIPRWLSVLVILLFLLALIGGLATLVIAAVVVETGELLQRLPGLINELTGYVQQLISQEVLTNLYDRFAFFYAQLDESYRQTLDENISAALHTISNAGKEMALDLLNFVKNRLLALPDTATMLVISVLAAFFISKDFYLWQTRFRRLLPSGVNSRIDQVVKTLRGALVGFIKAQLSLISITAAIVIVGLLILRVEYAVTIGLLTGLVDLLPYLGTGTVFVPWIVYAFFKGEYSLVIGLSILYGIVVVVRQVIEPKVVADNVGLDPLLTLIALFVGLHLFGFWGLIIGPVSLVVINALVRANVLADLWAYIKGKPS
ncbi:sporulation integral membrane protein YtvI [Brevibacillus marinus]|uniref:sporulation integral membrane protein YtvI n=1 Tax=Brevibacillus marinus TaxID=2496837 RepID=UPI000F8423D7|nr:sporulation integral membrane protein YtvI [Brevibacillus marinus]